MEERAQLLESDNALRAKLRRMEDQLGAREQPRVPPAAPSPNPAPIVCAEQTPTPSFDADVAAAARATPAAHPTTTPHPPPPINVDTFSEASPLPPLPRGVSRPGTAASALSSVGGGDLNDVWQLLDDDDIDRIITPEPNAALSARRALNELPQTMQTGLQLDGSSPPRSGPAAYRPNSQRTTNSQQQAKARLKAAAQGGQRPKRHPVRNYALKPQEEGLGEGDDE